MHDSHFTFFAYTLRWTFAALNVFISYFTCGLCNTWCTFAWYLRHGTFDFVYFCKLHFVLELKKKNTFSFHNINERELWRLLLLCGGSLFTIVRLDRLSMCGRRCGIMSSFFYTQLSDNGRGYRYQGVKRFLKKAKVMPLTDRPLWNRWSPSH